MWNLWSWAASLFAEKVAEEVVESIVGEHIEPEEGDWDWSKSADANQPLKDVSLQIEEKNISLIFGDVAQQVEKGFDTPQIGQMVNKTGRLSVGEKFFLEYNIKALGEGMALKIGAERLDADHVMIMLLTEPALANEIEKLIPKYTG